LLSEAPRKRADLKGREIDVNPRRSSRV